MKGAKQATRRVFIFRFTDDLRACDCGDASSHGKLRYQSRVRNAQRKTRISRHCLKCRTPATATKSGAGSDQKYCRGPRAYERYVMSIACAATCHRSNRIPMEDSGPSITEELRECALMPFIRLDPAMNQVVGLDKIGELACLKLRPLCRGQMGGKQCCPFPECRF